MAFLDVLAMLGNDSEVLQEEEQEQEVEVVERWGTAWLAALAMGVGTGAESGTDAGFTGDALSRAWAGSQSRRNGGLTGASCITHHPQQRRMRVDAPQAGSAGRDGGRYLHAIMPLVTNETWFAGGPSSTRSSARLLRAPTLQHRR